MPGLPIFEVTNMAESKKQTNRASRKAENSGAQPKGRRHMPSMYIAAAIAIIIIAAAAYIGYSMLGSSSVPFSFFKSGFQSAPRVSFTVTYSNLTQYSAENPCFTSIIQILAHSRKASTIDFFLVDQQNATCTYPKTGLGGNLSIGTSSSSYCLGIADSEPGIFLNYSSYNYTTITASRMFVYGNSNYMAQCPIAVELS